MQDFVYWFGLVFGDRVSPCIPGCPGNYVDQAGLKPEDRPALPPKC